MAPVAQQWFWPILQTPKVPRASSVNSDLKFFPLIFDWIQVRWLALKQLYFHSVCLGSLCCWNVHCFILIILVDDSGFVLIKNVSLGFTIKLSLGIVCSPVGPHPVYYGLKSLSLVSSDQTVFSQFFGVSSECCAANLKRTSTCFFFSSGALRGECAHSPQQLSALLIVIFETIVPANSRCFWSKWRTRSPWLTENSSDESFPSSVGNLARRAWLWLV